MKNKFQVGTVVHIDTDNKDWGRVAGEATIIEVTPTRLLVSAKSIQAYIYVSKKDAVKLA